MGNELPLSDEQPTKARETAAAGRRIASALLAHRQEAAIHLLNSIADWPRWRADISASAASEGAIDFFQPALCIFVDFLSLYFSTADSVWRRLYVGEKLKLVHEPGYSGMAMARRREQLAADDQRGLLTIFRRKLLPGDFAELERGLAEVTALLTARPDHSARVLMIGEFLRLDVLALLYGELFEEHVELEPTCLADADPAELHAAIGGLAGRVFDAIFYTPVSDLDSPGVAKLQRWSGMLVTGKSARELAESEVRQATETVELLRALWGCPIIVNNASAIARNEEQVEHWLCNRLTGRARQRFRAHVNRRLSEFALTQHQAGEDVTIFDEHALLAREDQTALGRSLHPWASKHPIVLGQRVAEGYRDRIIALMAKAHASPHQLIGIKDRPIGAGQAVDPILPPPIAAVV